MKLKGGEAIKNTFFSLLFFLSKSNRIKLDSL
eukprot:UN09276